MSVMPGDIDFGHVRTCLACSDMFGMFGHVWHVRTCLACSDMFGMFGHLLRVLGAERRWGAPRAPLRRLRVAAKRLISVPRHPRRGVRACTRPWPRKTATK